MPISQYDIDSFHSFATGELTNDNRNQMFLPSKNYYEPIY